MPPLPSLRRAVGSLHRKFVLETLAVASDSGNSERLAFALKGELAIVIFDTAVQIEPIPLLRVTDVVEGKIELRGPEKRYGVEPLALTEYVAGRGLSLALSYDPMLDANTIASERIGPASDVAGGENARDAGFEMLVDQENEEGSGKSNILLGYSTIRRNAQTRNLAVGIFVRRLFWLKRTDDTHAGRAPFNAVDPKTIRPGVPGTPVGGRTERWMES
jgi:hypothetical protein